ncbi:uncharacterized protein LOC143891045 [Tasmannia lanceolata]|uniref:uncharacterized protein LOC143891045 n=1 Tax=Tasmannia lanceolata TaxID=3420 RepID=UPI0040641E3D
MTSFNLLARILDDNKLIGSNYIDWKRNLTLVLTASRVYWILTTNEPEEPSADAPQNVRERRQKWSEDNEMAKCYILSSMSNVLQQQYIGMRTSSEIMINLKELFGEQHCAARLIAIKGLVSTKMVEGTPVRDHMLKMMGFLNELDILGAIIDAETQVDIVLASLPGSFKEFVNVQGRWQPKRGGGG